MKKFCTEKFNEKKINVTSDGAENAIKRGISYGLISNTWSIIFVLID